MGFGVSFGPNLPQGFYSLSDRVFYRQILWSLGSPVIGGFDKHLDSAAAEETVKFQNDWRLYEILQYDIHPLNE